ncbi:zinc-binding dehydrogenase [Ktedonobacter racemifer]|uniref:Alcohol dehydrogenase zinc-binding domain protein n=1 Tax=Ktedonobacter racemifer DSM 44963 TaxID=485913 RepID=D6U3I4_KTERA|nr:zinc-binding dehydrogenase [Ktedonobacter racemifer]EFH82974.1 Alcohol dehydrogenase zinc-binding domain protein [Ktedonobacter racemifer DSM 44963]
MDAAVLHEYGTPQFGTFDDPVKLTGTEIVDVTAAAISHFDLFLASGQHFLSPSQFPFVAGREGVGRLADGRRVYFAAPISPYGSMAQQTMVASQGLIEVPDGVDDAVAAALGNAGLAAWLPLEWRAQLIPGETVLVLGATGIAGQLAVQAAKVLGAGRVVAAGRNADMLRRVQELGADATVNLTTSDSLVASYREAAQGEIDVIIDYVWGPPTEAALQAATVGGRLVQVGTTAGNEITLKGSLIRNQSLTIFGYASGHVSLERRTTVYRHMAELAGQGRLIVPVERMPLQQVEQAWERQRAGTRQRLVLMP